MSESKRTLSLLPVVLAATLMAAVPLRAQSDRTSWNNLKKVKPGQEIEIVFNDAMSYKATLKSWNDDAIVARLSSGDMTFNRSDVMRVARYKANHRLRNTLIGAAVGVAVGGIFVASCGGYVCPQRTDKKVRVVSATSGIGAIVGLALPSGKGWEVVYRRQ
jgi:hypothetical protein